jgi:uncharacterized protein (TIRG00374 family)
LPVNQTVAVAARKRHALVALVAFGVVVYMAVALIADAARLQAALAQLAWTGIALVLALSSANYLLRFLRWQLYIEKLGHRVPPVRHLLYYFSGFAFTISPGKAGEAVRSVYLRDHGVTYSESLGALFVERLLDLVVMTLLAGCIVVSNDTYRQLFLGITIATLTLLVLVGHPAMLAQLCGWAERLQGKRLGRWLMALVSMLRSSQQLLRLQWLSWGTLLGLVAWGAEGLGLYLICRGLDLPLTLFEATGVYALSTLIGSAAIFMPAGIGSIELAMSTLLIAHGSSMQAALIATVLCRLATLWYAVLIGVVSAALLEFFVTRQRVPAPP